jgi:hypothetical protein
MMTAGPIVTQLSDFFSPWQTLYSDSSLVSSAVMAVHLLAVMFGGGLAIAADRYTLRMSRSGASERTQLLENIKLTHRPVLIALFFLFLSGAAQTAADIETFAASPVFWVKMGLVTLLLINGFVLERSESKLRQSSDDRQWGTLRATAVISMVLWSATLIAGTVLVNA